MLPSLLDMVRDKLKVTVPLPPDLTRTLEKNGENMVHQYYATKANKVIEHHRNNGKLPHDQRTLPQQSDMSWASDLINKKLASAEALVQGYMRMQNERQGLTAEQLHRFTSRQQTQLARHPYTPQPPPTVPQPFPGSGPRPPERTPMTDARDRAKTQEPSRLRRATVETVVDGETSSWDSTEYRSNESIFDSDESSRNGESMTSEEPAMASAWRDEWALDQEIYYS
jgi:hypothetical protein